MEESFPIRVVAQKTGLSPHVIRIWERRYGAICPQRSSSNRRLYSQEDIEKLIILRKLKDQGYAIGEIASRDLKELHKLLRHHSTPLYNTSGDRPSQTNIVKHFLSQALDKIIQLDEKALKKVLTQASLELSQRHILEKVIVPLMHEIGQRWQEGSLRINQEHFASSVIRSFLENLDLNYTTHPSAPTVVVATPAGQLHEIGALLAAKTATMEGWNVVYLGINLPAEDIANAVHKTQATLLALSIVYPGNDPHLAEELKKLKTLLPPKTPLVCGGNQAASYANTIHEIGGHMVFSLEALRKYLVSYKKDIPNY